ncbi:MAG: hypothetical protein ACKOWF_17610 [Chloroflexota bacterium]
MTELIAFVSFFALVVAWLAAPKDAVAETITVTAPMPVAEAKA